MLDDRKADGEGNQHRNPLATALSFCSVRRSAHCRRKGKREQKKEDKGDTPLFFPRVGSAIRVRNRNLARSSQLPPTIPAPDP